MLCPKRPDLAKLLRDSVEEVKQMTPDEREAMFQAQRKSWVRGEMGMGSDRDEAAYAKALREKDTETLKRLDIESNFRMKSVR